MTDTIITVTCSMCERPAIKRGMCNRHYLRWYKSTPKEQRRAPTVEERFWSKVKKSPTCWEWQGARRPSGHGMFLAGNGRCVSASAFSLELELGHPAPEGHECCHRCDNPPCVNPKHLYFGTRQDNVDDAWARGRYMVGEDRPAAILREAQVVEIREMYADGGDAKRIAQEFGIAVATLRSIVLGFKWRHAGGPITRRRPTTKTKRGENR